MCVCVCVWETSIHRERTRKIKIQQQQQPTGKWFEKKRQRNKNNYPIFVVLSFFFQLPCGATSRVSWIFGRPFHTHTQNKEKKKREKEKRQKWEIESPGETRVGVETTKVVVVVVSLVRDWAVQSAPNGRDTSALTRLFRHARTALTQAKKQANNNYNNNNNRHKIVVVAQLVQHARGRRIKKSQKSHTQKGKEKWPLSESRLTDWRSEPLSWHRRVRHQPPSPAGYPSRPIIMRMLPHSIDIWRKNSNFRFGRPSFLSTCVSQGWTTFRGYLRTSSTQNYKGRKMMMAPDFQFKPTKKKEKSSAPYILRISTFFFFFFYVMTSKGHHLVPGYNFLWGFVSLERWYYSAGMAPLLCYFYIGKKTKWNQMGAPFLLKPPGGLSDHNPQLFLNIFRFYYIPFPKYKKNCTFFFFFLLFWGWCWVFTCGVTPTGSETTRWSISIIFRYFFFVFRFPVLSVFEITPWSSPATTDVVVAADSCGNCFYFISFGIFYSNFTFKCISIAVPSIHRLSFVLLSIWRNVNAFRCFFFSLAIINCQRQTWVACCCSGSWVCVFLSPVHVYTFVNFQFFFSFSYQNKIKRNFVAACFSSFLFSLKKKKLGDFLMGE